MLHQQLNVGTEMKKWVFEYQGRNLIIATQKIIKNINSTHDAQAQGTAPLADGFAKAQSVSLIVLDSPLGFWRRLPFG